MADNSIRKACDRCHSQKLSCRRIGEEPYSRSNSSSNSSNSSNSNSNKTISNNTNHNRRIISINININNKPSSYTGINSLPLHHRRTTKSITNTSNKCPIKRPLVAKQLQ
ncbi:unnamed protein product [Clonostachys rosea]|uniref:Zn(2)-C6 fungal-type domain-containing protein n=1 Tax=Bionectria ochroleuca TaxID=29856 RepID=A0ABY6V4J2_BIOOC|nr:unnamed protein product [Clonostachys rosea]